LPALLGKWLCHDLATPAATVMTASELLGPVADAEINGLVQDGARRLVARLRLIRAVIAAGGAPLGAVALERLVRDGIDGTPLRWARPGDASGGEVALIAGAAMLLADVARGTPLTVRPTSVEWDAPRALPDAVAAALAGAEASDPRSAIAAMVAGAAARCGTVLRITEAGVAWH
jgi:hypothetical protein